jgi:hypothetical protein
VNTQGYPLEFAGAHAFKMAKFQVRQGIYFHDAVSEKLREIDIIASRERTLNRLVAVRAEYVVECKWSGSNPWVIFSLNAESSSPGIAVKNVIGTSLATGLLNQPSKALNIQALAPFRPMKRIGFNGRQMSEKQKQEGDPFYDAIRSVVGAAVSRCATFDRESFPTHGKEQPPVTALVCLPIIVVDGPLLEAYFDEAQATIQVAPIKWGRIYWAGSEHKRSMASIDVVAKTSLAEFIQHEQGGIDDLLSYLFRDVNRFFELRASGNQEEMIRLAGAQVWEDLPEWIQAVWHHQRALG